MLGNTRARLNHNRICSSTGCPQKIQMYPAATHRATGLADRRSSAMTTPITIAPACAITASTTVFHSPSTITPKEKNPGTSSHRIWASAKEKPSAASNPKITAALTHLPQCRSGTTGRSSVPARDRASAVPGSLPPRPFRAVPPSRAAIDGHLRDRALCDVPGFEDLVVRAVVHQGLQGEFDGSGELGIGLVHPDAVQPAVDRRQVHHLEVLALARRLRDVHRGRQV